MYKKIVALTIAAAFCCTAFSGCWWSNDDSSSSPMQSSTPSSSKPYSDNYSSSQQSSSGSESGSMYGSSSLQGSSTSTVANASVDVSAWELRLANAKTPLPEDFAIKTRSIKGYDSRLFDARAASSLEQMLDAAEKAGCKLYLVSAYRSISRQKALYEKKTAYFVREGKELAQAELEAAKWVARPGTSEHNLGLAADIVSADWYRTNTDLTADFEQTKHFEWLRTHCAEYGFIIRYPSDKQELTGITYEPWHYRYVGASAVEIMDKKLCLEEYLSLAN